MSRNQLPCLFAALALMTGCAAPSKNSSAQVDAYYAKETALRKAYKDCLIRSGKDASKCTGERDALYEQMEWNLLQSD